MTDAFIGEIRMLAFNFTPANGTSNNWPAWAPCQGQTVPVSQYKALFAVIGTTFGGDGVTTIGLPDLRGAAPIGATAPGTGAADEAAGSGVLDALSDVAGNPLALGTQVGNAAQVIPASAGVPFHGHALHGQSLALPAAGSPPLQGMSGTPSAGSWLSRAVHYNSSSKLYAVDRAFTRTNPGANAPVLNAGTIAAAGGAGGAAQPHENRQPYLTLNFCIALYGNYPSPA